MEFETEKNASINASKKGYSLIAVADDKNLAKDNTNWLIARGIRAEMKKCQEDQHSQPRYYISVYHEQLEEAVKLLEMKNPEDYFYDSLVFSGEQLSSDDI